MNIDWSWLAGGTGNVLLALLAGAGGSALLELFWRPRRDRRRAAALLTAEVALNTELLLLQAHARQENPLGVPADFKLSTIGWEAASDLISELPPKALRELVQLYAQYDAINKNVERFGEYLTQFQNASAGSTVAQEAETLLLQTVDVFNTGIDATIDRGQRVLPVLVALANIVESEAEKASSQNYRQIAAQHMTVRRENLEALRNRKRGS